MKKRAPFVHLTARAARRRDDWWRGAVIYQIYPRSFQDSNGDGIGDFRGLTAHLDHVQSLGVDTIWLLPFYPSPLRDDGYDISDYGAINPDFGTMKDFRRFIAEAKRRDLRVITEMPFEIRPANLDQTVWIHEFETETRTGAPLSHAAMSSTMSP